MARAWSSLPAPSIGTDAPRIDGRAKVTGSARYGSDPEVANPAYAVLVTSPIALGTIIKIEDGETRAVPGVLDVLTHANVGSQIKAGNIFSAHGYMGTSIAPLASARIFHDGQVVAMVVADTYEAASEGAGQLKVSYAEEKPAATFDNPGTTVVTVKDVAPEHEDPAVGDAPGAFASAPVKVDAQYSTPTQHHNPIELFTTTCAWSDDTLTVWESSQNVTGFKYGLAQQLGLDPDNIRVVSHYIGGAFGSRGSLTQRTAIVALAARRIGRPVKLFPTRMQGFTIATYRAETRHHVRLGADAQGRLLALIHDGWEVTSRPDAYRVAGTDATTRLYGAANVASKVSIVHADRNTPGFMRSPPEVPYLFALESAMDELAVALKMDPVELRRVNDTQKEPIKGLPYTSRNLMPCFDAAQKEFGWKDRNPAPRSMRDGDWLVGWGCATSMYPTHVAPATARVTLSPLGLVKVETAAHDIGTGAYTVIAQTAAARLGLDLDRVEVALGDTRLPPAPVAGGSNTTASVCTVVDKACDDIRLRIARAAVSSNSSPFAAADPNRLFLAGGMLRDPDGRSEPLDTAIARAAPGALEAYAENIPHGVSPDGLKKLYRGMQSLAGGAELKDRIQFAFGAEFVEVKVHALTGEIRCPRIVGAFSAGRIVNPRTAHSQLMGGLIWGVSSALHEATEIDQRAARYYNTDLAEYLIPVNADIIEAQVIMLAEEDHDVNPLGIKGIGELANVGTNAAVANAVFHATGVRIRDLPIRIEKLLGSTGVHA